ncbi:o-succinylbenzoate--CoA ligase [Virgibacillus sp. W0181]|uniref:o-succinylbenzoate--CoA ligase n=1 Tax=Virgibacillus sp. W0181 TaxID=3391581 RepID=UPI003F447674
MQQTVPHWLTKQAMLAPAKTAIEQENGKTMTYETLMKKSQSFARKLASLQVKENTHVGILATNSIDMIIAIYALSYLNAVAVLFNTRLTREELQSQITDADLTLLLTTADLKVDKSLEKSLVFKEVNHYKETPIKLEQQMNLNHPFTMMYTSGTTGKPKAVIHTYGNYWWSAINSSLNLGVVSHDKWLAVLPMFHIGGMSIFIRSVIYGTAVLLMEKFDEAAVHHAIMEKNVTMISVVTVMLQKLVERLGEDKYPPTLRVMLLGGGPAPKTLLERAKNRNMPVFQSYGMTETSSQIVALSPANALDKIGSSGKPLMSAEVKINNPDDDSVGEIFVKGPMVSNGYYKRESINKQVYSEGWLATGDLGYFDEEGYLFVVDRRKDLIISGGENIYPSEIEQTLTRMPEIREAGVIGKKDTMWGEVPVAFVVVTDPSVNAEKVITFAKKYLAKYKLPKEIHFIEQLPRNASNKLVRSELFNQLPCK